MSQIDQMLSHSSSLYSSHEKIGASGKTLSVGGSTGGYESDETRSHVLMRSSTERHHRQESNECEDETSSQLLDDYCCSSPVSSPAASASNTTSSRDQSDGKNARSVRRQYRERARSLSCSPSSSMLGGGGGISGFGFGTGTGIKSGDEAGANDLVLLQNERFKDIFPEACKQMEDNLAKYIELNRLDLIPTVSTLPPAITNLALSNESQSDSQASSTSSQKLLQTQTSISSHSSM